MRFYIIDISRFKYHNQINGSCVTNTITKCFGAYHTSCKKVFQFQISGASEVEKLGLSEKYIRRELYGEIHGADTQEDYPGGAPNEVTIHVSIMDQSWDVKGDPNDTIMQILEKNHIPVPSRCRCGVCGFCHSYLRKGKVYIPEKMEARRVADKKYGFIHPCCTFPLSDLEIEVPYSK